MFRLTLGLSIALGLGFVCFASVGCHGGGSGGAGGGSGSGGGSGGGAGAGLGGGSGGASGNWYGTVLIQSLYATHSNDGTHAVDHQEKATTRIDIDSTGARSIATDDAMSDVQSTLINMMCYRQMSTNYVHGDSSEQSSAQGFFNLTLDAANGYASAEPATAFTLPPQTWTTHNRAETSTCDGAGVQTSTGMAVTTLSGPLPLDQVKGTLSADKRTASGSASGTDAMGNVWTVVWSLKRDKNIVAVVADQTVTRASVVTLDGSASHGQIDSYTWTVIPTQECANVPGPNGTKVSIGHSVTHVGRTFAFPVLCSVFVRLHVEGPGGDDDALALVTVLPRGWSTTAATPVKQVSGALGADLGASNRCARDNGAATNHLIHTVDPAAATWKDSAYQVQQLDPAKEGPFAGLYYLDTPEFHVDRLELIHDAYLPPSGAAYLATSSNDMAVGGLLDPLLEGHARAHSSLLSDWVSWHTDDLDPAVQVEPLASEQMNDLISTADATIKSAEVQLCAATAHPAVFSLLQPQSSDPAWSGPADVYPSAGGTPIHSDVMYQAVLDDAVCP